MKIRYLKQYDKTSCGPVAIANVMKYLGYKTTAKSISFLRDLCNTDYEGTDIESFDKTLRVLTKLKAKIYKIKNKKYKKAINHLKNGGAIVLLYSPSVLYGLHFAMFLQENENYITGINTINSTYEHINFENIKNIFNSNWNSLWLIYKRKDI